MDLLTKTVIRQRHKYSKQLMSNRDRKILKSQTVVAATVETFVGYSHMSPVA